MQLLTHFSETHLNSVTRNEQRQERVLFAFNDKDRSLFFPSYEKSFPGAGHRERLDTNTLKSPAQWEGYLKEYRPTVIVSCWSTPPLPEALLCTDELPLRYLCHTTGTVKNLVPRKFLLGGGLVSNWGTVISHNVAEHALLLTLTSMRNITSWRPAMKEGPNCWGNSQLLKTRSLRGKTVGLHGFGNIANELVRLLGPFDVQILSYSHNVPPACMRDKGVTPCPDLMDLFRQCDVVIECEALTPHSAASVTEAHFRAMPEEAVFVNVGRGAVVDETAMLKVAAEGRIRVACDVFQQEPLPVDSPFFDIDGVIISPHIAGPSGDWFYRCGDYALNNVARYLEGQPLNGMVTLEVYDRST